MPYTEILVGGKQRDWLCLMSVAEVPKRDFFQLSFVDRVGPKRETGHTYPQIGLFKFQVSNHDYLKFSLQIDV